jgi:hypothetical protein
VTVEGVEEELALPDDVLVADALPAALPLVLVAATCVVDEATCWDSTAV